MPEAVGRQCPSCGRRVPRTVAKCRCGADLPKESLYAAEAPAGGKSAWPTLLALALVVGGAGYWTLFRTKPAPPVETAAPSESAGAALLGAAAPAGKREISAEERAWNLAANTREAPRAPTKLGEEPLAPAADNGPAAALEDMVDRAMPSIVLVETSGGRGSAFYVQHDTLITNVHVVQQDSYVTLRRMDGSSVQARVHSRAPTFDIAVLKVASPSPSQPVLPMGSARSLKPGQEVIVIGSALGTLQNSVSRGIVSGLRESGGVTLVQSDAAANPGNSGGPMLDRSGRVVGILTAGYRDSQGLNFAVSIDHARDILEGRQKDLGTSQTGLKDIQSAGSQASESDRRQKQGEQEFMQRVASAEQAANQLDPIWQRFRKDCYTSRISGSYDREWFAVFAPGALPTDAAAGCVSYWQNMTREMNRVKDYMRETIQNARRANLMPGTVRDTLRQKRLTYDWER